ncbi:MAG: hypothetical protein A3H96_22780 [Acidobacteria bacterium RIFCSPLOWO2_02_FULL_67_36]|nr:MAG: hypothetical protein A3H96_22780 [Acidobacteria bacterium RIFCSPLOWO2_02_FULL_67_36]OFW26360.1 MAG: hypothetical protein A3G21_27115 [Acidobacteria bacterium RIFCSPLOWO2_12_FULL_66_21]
MTDLAVVRRPGVRLGVVAALGLVACALLAGSIRPAGAQNPSAPDSRFAGLQWTFARIRYTAWTVPSGRFSNPEDEPWYIDAPAAEWNLSRRVRTVTSIQVNDPVVLTLEDPNLWSYPWLYIVEPGNLRLKDSEVPILREFLLRGGTLTFDDFHGPVEWANLESELRRVFPDRKIVDLQPSHPIFHCFYRLDSFPQTPGLGSFLQGRTYEKGGFVPHLRAMTDDTGRAMVLINWNVDMGDGWEWSNAADYPGYVKYTAVAYRMMINEIVYSLTH